MTKFIKCFEKINGEYREIPYSELVVNGKRNPKYVGRYFLPLDGYLMEVSHKDYIDFYKDIRHRKYIHEEAVLHGEISYSAIDNDELNGEELIRDIFTDVEDEAITTVMVNKLRKALQALTPTEMHLIDALYFREVSEVNLAIELKINQSNISRRKDKILRTLKKLLKT